MDFFFTIMDLKCGNLKFHSLTIFNLNNKNFIQNSSHIKRDLIAYICRLPTFFKTFPIILVNGDRIVRA